MSPLNETVRRTIARYGMLAQGDKVVLGVSGGPDSVAMLHVLAGLAPEYGVSLAVAHLDHGFRPDSGEDAAFVSEAADRLGLPFVMEKSDLKERLMESPANRQAAARDARYAFFERAAAGLGAGRIAVGHTADDQAETYLMREIRGSGVQGLSSIPPVRGRIVRPLIEAGRDEVEAYLRENGISFRTDPTNLQPTYLRNRLRLEVMPLLRRYNPQVTAALCHAADILREEDEFLSAYTGDLLRGLVAEASGGLLALDLKAFMGLPTAIKRRVLRLAVKHVKGDTLGMGYGHIIEAVRSVAAGGTGRGLDMPGEVRVEKSYDRLMVYRPEAAEVEYSVELPVPGRVEIAGIGVTVEARPVMEFPPGPGVDEDRAVFDMERLGGPLEVRSRRPGDFFYPAGMEGRKKLGDYFIDMKLPRLDRARTPLLTCGGEVAWVMGMRLDRRFIAGEKTKKALSVTYKKGARN